MAYNLHAEERIVPWYAFLTYCVSTL